MPDMDSGIESDVKLGDAFCKVEDGNETVYMPKPGGPSPTTQQLAAAMGLDNSPEMKEQLDAVEPCAPSAPKI